MTLSGRHEGHLASVVPGGKRVAGSGSKRESHDVFTPTGGWWQFRYEAKCTQNKSYSFKEAEWRRLVEDVYSRDARERPAWAVRFYGEGGSEDAPVLNDLIVVDLNDWVELLEERVELLEELETLRAQEAEQVP